MPTALRGHAFLSGAAMKHAHQSGGHGAQKPEVAVSLAKQQVAVFRF
jgi:hypothetical protein